MTRRILIIGTTGQVGWELFRCAQPLGRVTGVDKTLNKFSETYIDLTDPDSIRRVIKAVNPHIILNAAAYTAVDKSEQEVELAHQLNEIAPGILAEESRRSNALLVHYSTDYVFDGRHTQPYTESDTPNPQGVYGASKLAGDRAIEAVGGNYFILRTAWVYGLRGQNFLLTMQRLAKERTELKIVADQVGAPTWSRMIAEATVQVLAQIHSPHHESDMTALRGIYNLTCDGQASWYEFTRAIFASAEKKPTILPITTADYPTPAKRPAYSVLANTKLLRTFGIKLPDWEMALNLCLSSNS